MTGALVFFDGECHLCNGVVDRLLALDRRGALRFAPLRGRTFTELEATHPGLAPAAPGGVPASLVVQDTTGVHLRSAAVLRILHALGGAWRAAALPLRLVPRPVRDAVYDYVARHRYGWFGRRDACRVPSPDLRERFLD